MPSLAPLPNRLGHHDAGCLFACLKNDRFVDISLSPVKQAVFWLQFCLKTRLFIYVHEPGSAYGF